MAQDVATVTQKYSAQFGYRGDPPQLAKEDE
jgi:hypothetical protein